MKKRHKNLKICKEKTSETLKDLDGVLYELKNVANKNSLNTSFDNYCEKLRNENNERLNEVNILVANIQTSQNKILGLQAKNFIDIKTKKYLTGDKNEDLQKINNYYYKLAETNGKVKNLEKLIKFNQKIDLQAIFKTDSKFEDFKTQNHHSNHSLYTGKSAKSLINTEKSRTYQSETVINHQSFINSFNLRSLLDTSQDVQELIDNMVYKQEYINSIKNIMESYDPNYKTLVCAASNIAVNVLKERLVNQGIKVMQIYARYKENDFHDDKNSLHFESNLRLQQDEEYQSYLLKEENIESEIKKYD